MAAERGKSSFLIFIEESLTRPEISRRVFYFKKSLDSFLEFAKRSTNIGNATNFNMSKIFLVKRLFSMFLDYFIMTLIATMVCLPLLVIDMLLARYLNFKLPFIIFGILAFFIVLNKDYFRGKSIAKRLLGFQVFDRETNQVASKAKCFVRNLTLLLWPIEVLITLFSSSRRLGDFIVNTEIRVSSQEPVESIIQDLKRNW